MSGVDMGQAPDSICDRIHDLSDRLFGAQAIVEVVKKSIDSDQDYSQWRALSDAYDSLESIATGMEEVAGDVKVIRQDANAKGCPSPGKQTGAQDAPRPRQKLSAEMEVAIDEQRTRLWEAQGIVQCAVLTCDAELDQWGMAGQSNVESAFNAAIRIMGDAIAALEGATLVQRAIGIELEDARVTAGGAA